MRLTIELESSFDNWLKLMNYLKESDIELIHVVVAKSMDNDKNVEEK